MVTVKAQKNGEIIIKLSTGDYRLLRWILSDMVSKGNTAEQIDKLNTYLIPYFPAKV